MTTSKQGFTKGPWIFRPKSSTFHQTSNTHPYGECIFALEEGFEDEQLPSQADIALIGAAPDLYEALAGYMDAVEIMTLAMRDGVNVQGAVSALLGWEEMARAALARAAGEGE